MKRTTKRNKQIILALALLIAFGLVWSRLRIYVWLHASFWPVVLLLLGLALALYLGLSALSERRPPDPPPGTDER
jgi:cell division protein FtsW (lipid II flippase)